MSDITAQWFVFAAITIGTLAAYWRLRRDRRTDPPDYNEIRDRFLEAARTGRPIVLPNEPEIRLVTTPIPEFLAEIDRPPCPVHLHIVCPEFGLHPHEWRSVPSCACPPEEPT